MDLNTMSDFAVLMGCWQNIKNGLKKEQKDVSSLGMLKNYCLLTYLISFPIQTGSQYGFYSLGQYGTSTHIFEHRLLSGSEVKRGE